MARGTLNAHRSCIKKNFNRRRSSKIKSETLAKIEWNMYKKNWCIVELSQCMNEWINLRFEMKTSRREKSTWNGYAQNSSTKSVQWCMKWRWSRATKKWLKNSDLAEFGAHTEKKSWEWMSRRVPVKCCKTSETRSHSNSFRIVCVLSSSPHSRYLIKHVNILLRKSAPILHIHLMWACCERERARVKRNRPSTYN